MQVVSFVNGKRVPDNIFPRKCTRKMTHLVLVSSDKYTKCGKDVSKSTGTWDFSTAQFNDYIEAIKYHITCKACLKGYV